MVRDAKAVAGNIRDQQKAGQWRDSNKDLLDSVGQVRIAVGGPDAVVEPQIDMASLQLGTDEIAVIALLFMFIYLSFILDSWRFFCKSRSSFCYHWFNEVRDGKSLT